jgi:hydroxyacylglutathione hydrolase
VRVRAIWNTHHHHDHVGGNEEIARALGIDEVVAYVSDRGRIPLQSKFVEDAARFKLGELDVRTMHIPGHTMGAVAYVVEGDGGARAVFTGDTLFLAGCGRLFEGTPADMHTSLTSLMKLDATTAIYCGHEYTASNLRFAAHVEPQNKAIGDAAARVQKSREAGTPSVPWTIAEDRAVNPFLRTDSQEIRATLGIASDANGADALGAIRRAKDTFK